MPASRRCLSSKDKKPLKILEGPRDRAAEGSPPNVAEDPARVSRQRSD
jgi:hypothetical protein